LARFEAIKSETLYLEDLLLKSKTFIRKQAKSAPKFMHKTTDQIVSSWSPKRLQTSWKKTENGFVNSDYKMMQL